MPSLYLYTFSADKRPNAVTLPLETPLELLSINERRADGDVILRALRKYQVYFAAILCLQINITIIIAVNIFGR